MSDRFVWVWPVIMAPPYLLKYPYESLLAKYDMAISLSLTGPCTTAPAARLLPSMPSVPMEAITIPSPMPPVCSLSTSSWFRPPLPFPVTRTVGSPPNIRHVPLSGILAASISPISPTSPKQRAVLISYPRRSARLAMARMHVILLAIT